MKGISKRHAAKFRIRNFDTAIVIMSVCLLFGIVLGCATSVRAESSFSPFAEYTALSDGVSVNYSFSKVYLNMVKYPLIVFILGFTAFGQLAIPLVVAVKGFFISFSVSLIMRGAGLHGLLSAMSVFGVQALLSIPCLLILAGVAFRFSKLFALRIQSQPSGIQPPSVRPGVYFSIFGIFLLLCLIFSLIDTIITPRLVSLIII